MTDLHFVPTDHSIVFGGDLKPNFIFTEAEYQELVALPKQWERAGLGIRFPQDSNVIELSAGLHFRMYVTVEEASTTMVELRKAIETFKPVLEFCSGVFPRKGFPGFRKLLCDDDCGYSFVERCRDVLAPSTDPCQKCGERMEIVIAIVGDNPGHHIVNEV